MVARFIKSVLPYSGKCWLHERVLRLYGIPWSRHGIPGPLIRRFRGFGPVNLIDIGAASGYFTENVDKFCGVRSALLVEPIPKRCEELRAKFAAANFKIICGAAGDREGELKMDVLGWDNSSSILPVLRSDPNVTAGVDLSVAETIRTRMQSLDRICVEQDFLEPVDLLKIDVQGAEHLVLDGAREVLQRVRAIWTEVSFRPLYEGSLTFEGISERCRSAGFMLAAITDGFCGANGELLQADVLFVRPDRAR